MFLSVNTPRVRRTSLMLLAALAVAVGMTVSSELSSAPRAGASSSKPHALAPGEIYSLSVPNVPGEGTEGTGSIEVDSFSWGVSNNTVPVSSGVGKSSKGKFTDLTVSRQLDKSSPIFFNDCYKGAMFESVTLYIQPGGQGGDDMTIKMGHAVVASVAWTGGSADRPTEVVTFRFTSGQITYASRASG
jgi:type VI secretion system secreted protein Hcp